MTSGRPIALHIANSGRLATVLVPGARVLYAPADPADGSRRTAGSAVLAEHASGWVTVDAGLVGRAMLWFLQDAASRPTDGAGALDAAPASPVHPLTRYFRGFDGAVTVRGEYRLGSSRVDAALLDTAGSVRGLVEFKSVTLATDRTALFPDAPTARGTKHVAMLAALAREGACGAGVVFGVGRRDADCLRPCVAIDPAFGRALADAAIAGVRLLALRVLADPTGLTLGGTLPIEL